MAAGTIPSTVLDLFPVACFTADSDGRIRQWNLEATRLTGYPQHAVAGQVAGDLLCDPADRHALEAAVRDALTTNDRAETDLPLVCEGGRQAWVHIHVRPFDDGIIVAAADITRRKREEGANLLDLSLLRAAHGHLSALAATDGLTGLLNHRAFRERLGVELRRALHSGHPLSLLFLDVDHFKPINDTFGHPAGDEVLRALAPLLTAGVRPCDIVARYGGEEFAVVLSDTGRHGAEVVGERLRVSIARHPWTLRPLTVSIGAATTDHTVVDANDLLARADRALYVGKQTGRNRYVAWETLGEAPSSRIELAEWLHRIEDAQVDPTGDVTRRLIQQAILDHFQWKNRMRSLIGGEASMSRVELTDHHACRLGRWYLQAGDLYRTNSAFQDMEAPHAELHALAGNIVDAVKDGRAEEAAASLRDLETCSMRIVDCLERLCATA